MYGFFKKNTVFMFVILSVLIADSYAQNPVARRSGLSLADKFYNNGRGFPLVVKDKNFTYYNAGVLGGNSLQNLTVRTEENCDFAINDCVRRVCKRRADLNKYGSYVYCSSNSLTTVSDEIQNCLVDKGVLEGMKYGDVCKGFIVGNLYRFYEEQELLESEYAKVSATCVRAKDNLDAAEQCYFYLMTYNGEFDNNLKDTLRQFCGGVARGGSEDMMSQFFSAGSYGLSDIYSGSMTPTMPFANPDAKRQNWHEVVGVLYDRYRKNMVSSCGGQIE